VSEHGNDGVRAGNDGVRASNDGVRAGRGFRWDGVDVRAYKAESEAFRDVTRQILFGRERDLPFELRYFEIGPRGHTTLERHAHPHAVVVVRGRGRVLIAERVSALQPHDLVDVPPMTWHQFRADDDELLGFLCLGSAERDRPVRPTDEELTALRAIPGVADFLRG
jgi:quercetin dioxygenase-like cupin family protein